MSSIGRSGRRSQERTFSVAQCRQLRAQMGNPNDMGAVTRTTPRGLTQWASASASIASPAANCRDASSSARTPRSDRDNRRDVRWNRVAPSFRSRPVLALETVACHGPPERERCRNRFRQPLRRWPRLQNQAVARGRFRKRFLSTNCVSAPIVKVHSPSRANKTVFRAMEGRTRLNADALTASAAPATAGSMPSITFPLLTTTTATSGAICASGTTARSRPAPVSCRIPTPTWKSSPVSAKARSPVRTISATRAAPKRAMFRS